MNRLTAASIAIGLILTPGVAAAKTWRIEAGPQAGAQVQAAVQGLEPGDEIRFGEGRFVLPAGFAVAVERVTIRGRGPQETILDFGSAAPGPALTLSANRLTVRDLAVENAPGTGITAAAGDRLTLRDVAVIWSRAAPAQADAIAIGETSSVLIEKTLARGAGDAGLEIVGARDVVVRESTFEGGDVGVRLASTRSADLYLNTVVGARRLGVEVSDLPGLPRSGAVRLLENMIRDNGPQTAPGSDAPSGVGVRLGATTDVHVFLNEIVGHGAAGVALLASSERGAEFSPLPVDVVVRENRFGRSGFWTEGPLNAAGAGGADVIWDGATAYVTPQRPRDEPVRFSLQANTRLDGTPIKAVNLNLRAVGVPLSEAFVSEDLPLVEPGPAPRPVRLPQD